MRLGLRTIVETVHALHDLAQLSWNAHGPEAPAIRPARVTVVIKLHLERLCEIMCFACENNTSRSFVHICDGQSSGGGEFTDLLDVGWISTVAGSELLT